jgi:hypothetical protein
VPVVITLATKVTVAVAIPTVVMGKPSPLAFPIALVTELERAAEAQKK